MDGILLSIMNSLQDEMTDEIIGRFCFVMMKGRYLD